MGRAARIPNPLSSRNQNTVDKTAPNIRDSRRWVFESTSHCYQTFSSLVTFSTSCLSYTRFPQINVDNNNRHGSPGVRNTDSPYQGMNQSKSFYRQAFAEANIRIRRRFPDFTSQSPYRGQKYFSSKELVSLPICSEQLGIAHLATYSY